MKILKKNRLLLLLTAVIIAALTAFAGCQPQSRDKQNIPPQNNTEQTVVAPQPEEQAPEDLKGFSEYTIKKQLGEKNNTGKDRIKSIVIKGSETENEIIVELNGNDVSSADMTIRGMLMDSKKILEPLSKRQDVHVVSVSEYLDVEDIDGGTVEEWVFTLVLDRKGLDKVASGDYLLNDLTTIAKEYKVHPNFMRE